MLWYEFLLLAFVVCSFCFGFLRLVFAEIRIYKIREQRDHNFSLLCEKLIEELDRSSFDF